MSDDGRPVGQWGGYSFTDGFGQSDLLSEEAKNARNAEMQRPALDIDGDIQELRDKIDELNEDLPRWLALFPCEFESGEVSGVHTGTTIPLAGVAEENQDRILVNFAGGGMITCTPRGGQTESVPVAGTGRVRVVSVAYRQGPEHRFPAGSDDGVTVYKHLLENYEPRKIGIYGGSAGGWIALQTIAHIIDQDLPVPGALVLTNSSAIYDGRRMGDARLICRLAEGERPMTMEQVRAPMRPDALYMADLDHSDPLVSPTAVPGFLSQYPPTLFLTAVRDFMLSDAAYSHGEFLAAGVDSHLYVQDGLGHSFPECFAGTPEATAAYNHIWRFFDRYLDPVPR